MGSTDYLNSKFSEPKRPRKGAWLACETCKKEFYVHPSRLTRNVSVRFCSASCYKKDGNNNPFYGGRHATSLKEKWKGDEVRQELGRRLVRFNQTRWADTVGYKSVRAFIRRKGKCNRCSFSDVRILQRHHKDRNTSNNHESNIEVLCPNCHNLEHYLSRDGTYTNLKEIANAS